MFIFLKFGKDFIFFINNGIVDLSLGMILFEK